MGEGRRLRRLHSVRVRITLAAVLVTAIAVSLAGWLLLRSVEDTQIGQLRDDINEQLDDVVARLDAGDDPQDAVRGSPTDPVVTVTDAHGRVVASSPGARTTTNGEPPEASGDARGTGDADVTGAMVDDDGDLVTAQFETLTRIVDTPSGTYTVTAAAPVEQVARSVDAVRRALVVGLPAVVVLVAAVAWVLVGRALRPVEAIRAEVDEITATTMHRRVPEPPTGDEIGRLARTMNAMLGRLDRAATRQRQFVSDASHELRSPVAAIRTGLEVARRNPARANWPAVADAALADEARLEALLDDLLLLAAHDENGTGAQTMSTSVDLAAVTTAQAGRPRRVPVELDIPAVPSPDAVVVPGDADQLARVVSNLLDNAARHATSAVRASLAPPNGDGTVRLTVDDDGPGIPPGDRERVFERFTRLDDGRARDDGGAGLGLAVARSIVTRHRGRISAGDSPLSGARLTVDLPARHP
jgi:signal transduction histidine kinase